VSSEDHRASLKRQAAEYAVTFVESGMVVGLGAGSTASFALQRLATLLGAGELRDIAGVPCSRIVAAQARHLGISLTTLNEHPVIDLTIDGADEVDPQLNLIKGGGGALLHEKMVAVASRREIIVIDEGKRSPQLGTQWPVPVEVVHFGWQAQVRFLEKLGARATVRLSSDGTLFETDEGHLIIDCAFGPLAEFEELAAALRARPGVVEHGLFIGLANDLIVAGQDGIQHVRREDPRDA
jgi:ribose 5-phosphate isomerase A